MLTIRRLDNANNFTESFSRSDFIDFLHTHLGRFRDAKEAIDASIGYAFSDAEGKGGFLVLAHEGDTLVGAAVINRTGMEKYIPAHLLVYIAVDAEQRGKGVGRRIVEYIQKECRPGGLALHVEYDNPARRLYERLGFTSKYAEMRYDPSADTSAAPNANASTTVEARG